MKNFPNSTKYIIFCYNLKTLRKTALPIYFLKLCIILQGYLFGCHLALAWQAFLDLEAFTGPEPDSFSLVGAPLAFTLEARPELYSYIEAGKKSVRDVDYHEVRF